MTSFIQRLEAARAKARQEALQRAQDDAEREASAKAKAESDARSKAILAALNGHPAREWEEWVSTPEILDALNLPRGKKAYALIETEMRALGWTPVRTVRRGGHLRYYVKPRGYVRGRKTGRVAGPQRAGGPCLRRSHKL